MNNAAVSLAILSIALAACDDGPAPQAPAAAERPNVVLILADNVGWGEIGAYGSVRGPLTPRIDQIAREGIRLDNFNTEPSCTISRAALMTGRHAIRTGATQPSGITLWEVTLAEGLRGAGYATGLFGKWHLGGDHPEGRREPGHQGFDEFYGIPRTSHESQTTIAMGSTEPGTSRVWEGKAGTPTRQLEVFDLEARRRIDRAAAERGVAFMERNVDAKTPFFLYYPMTHLHFPTLAHPEFAGVTGAGDLGDAIADMDHNVGLVLDAIDRLGIREDTLVMWCADNGAEARRPWRGSPGPWSGFYNSVMEGGVRTPCVIRWPGHIPEGRVTNEIVHEVDLFPTIARAVGADIVPRDRPIDGVDQLPLLLGEQDRSSREHVIYYFGTDVSEPRAVKWRDWKLHYSYQAEPKTAQVEPLMRLFHLRSDPREEFDIKDANPWAEGVMNKLVADFVASTVAFPNVPPGAPDPYVPPAGGPR